MKIYTFYSNLSKLAFREQSSDGHPLIPTRKRISRSKTEGPYHKDRGVQTIIGEVIFQARPLLKRFHSNQDVDFGPQSTKSSPKEAVSLVGKIRSIFLTGISIEASEVEYSSETE
jgi:hypothetical protein